VGRAAAFQPQRPFALQLQYHRNISRERLVDTTSMKSAA
jgi:hypothetical protein